jgi:hypothetical protein
MARFILPLSPPPSLSSFSQLNEAKQAYSQPKLVFIFLFQTKCEAKTSLPDRLSGVPVFQKLFS